MSTGTSFGQNNKMLLPVLKPRIQSTTDYPSPAWSSDLLIFQINRIQAIQNTAFWVILGYALRTSTKHLHA